MRGGVRIHTYILIMFLVNLVIFFRFRLNFNCVWQRLDWRLCWVVWRVFMVCVQWWVCVCALGLCVWFNYCVCVYISDVYGRVVLCMFEIPVLKFWVYWFYGSTGCLLVSCAFSRTNVCFCVTNTVYLSPLFPLPLPPPILIPSSSLCFADYWLLCVVKIYLYRVLSLRFLVKWIFV